MTCFRDIHLSKDQDTEGLDLEAAQTWIYPTNYTVRDYQFNIVQKALLENTLVNELQTFIDCIHCEEKVCGSNGFIFRLAYQQVWVKHL